SVWAYREGRAKKISNFYDLLLTILPFEPPYFTKYGLKSVFIGHPITENKADLSKKEEVNKAFRKKHHIASDDKVICIIPGSRVGEVTKIYPEFIKAINILKGQYNNIVAVIPLTPKTSDIVKKISKNLVTRYVLINRDEKEAAFFASNFALAKSGTNNLELSLYQIPTIIAYKVNKLSYFLAKMLIKVRFINLINIILNEPIIVEMIQEDCQGEKMAKELDKLLKSEQLQNDQINLSKKALALLGLNFKETPSKKAAKEIIEL
ncbi:MAG: lipid-A-disaccharide synthase, partial [Rickettsiales bacterium]|nr:lipid-A-disaccharide synthase [Rickettsiales bacterium]